MFTFPLFLLSPDAPLLLLLLLLLPVIVLLQVELALPSRRLHRGDPEVAISTDIDAKKIIFLGDIHLHEYVMKLPVFI